MSKYITHDHDHDGVDRRGFLKCMAWAGTGMLWAASSGVLSSRALGGIASLDGNAGNGGLFFAQLSDSHIGFSKDANRDVTATLEEAVRRVNALPRRPAFILHTGDISQLSKPDEFDTAMQIISTAKTTTGKVFWVPGEHDVLDDDGASYRQRFGKGATGGGWYSMDYEGMHFIGLVNVMNLKPGGLGQLGSAQLEWLARDVRGLPSSTPIVVFAHVPLWTVYPAWGWGTDDGAQALSYLKRFGSVTVLNGHIHQVLQKVEGNVTFHTAMSTAFPQPAPGTAAAPGPLTVPADRLRDMLGIASVTYHAQPRSLAVVDATLSGAPVGGAGVPGVVGASAATATSAPAAANEIDIDNFSFTPPGMRVTAGTEVTWLNRDDVPHKIVSVDSKFAPSPVLDTGGRFAMEFAKPGTYPYYCAIHPKMTGTVTVQ